MIRRQCACGCGQWFDADRERAKFLNWDHYTRSPHLKAQREQASRKAKTVRDTHRANMALKGFGRLSVRELAIYERGRHNGWSSGYDMGRRKGFADACREAPEITWRKRRAA
jgi:hypothetical protein